MISRTSEKWSRTGREYIILALLGFDRSPLTKWPPRYLGSTENRRRGSPLASGRAAQVHRLNTTPQVSAYSDRASVRLFAAAVPTAAPAPSSLTERRPSHTNTHAVRLSGTAEYARTDRRALGFQRGRKTGEQTDGQAENTMQPANAVVAGEMQVLQQQQQCGGRTAARC